MWTKYFTIFGTLTIVMLNCNSQTLDGCGTEFGCFSGPTGCVNGDTQDASECLFVHKFRGNPTDSNMVDFILTGKVANPSSAYLAIGFAYKPKMANSSIVICKFSPSQNISTVEHYYAHAATRPTIIDLETRDLGIRNPQLIVEDSVLTCKFSRLKSLVSSGFESKFFDLSPKDTIYLLGAKGTINNQGEPSGHSTNRVAGEELVDFESIKTITSSIKLGLVKVHGSLMIIAWVLFASIGICLPRYLKFLYPEKKFFNVDFWFFLHRLLMVSVPVLSIAAFLAILAFNEWKWTSSFNKKAFIHSILGIITITLSVVQYEFALEVLAGFMRPDKDAPNRKLFNWTHRISGVTTFFLSVATVCLAYNFMLEGNSWTIALVWVVWIVIVPLVFETLESKKNKVHASTTTSNGVHIQEKGKDEKQKVQDIKRMLFFIHFSVQAIVTVLFIVRIAII